MLSPLKLIMWQFLIGQSKGCPGAWSAVLEATLANPFLVLDTKLEECNSDTEVLVTPGCANDAAGLIHFSSCASA